MNRILALAAAACFHLGPRPRPTCTAPKEKWDEGGRLQGQVEAQGYRIKTFKVTKNDCYEIYGFDKDGKKVSLLQSWRPAPNSNASESPSGGARAPPSTPQRSASAMPRPIPNLPCGSGGTRSCVFHWSLVSCVIRGLNFFVVDDGEPSPDWSATPPRRSSSPASSGASSAARTRASPIFFPTPARLRAHLAAIRAGRHDFQPGHNPLGALG